MSNHLAKNLITRGNMNTSAITRGFVLPFPMPEMAVRPRGYASNAYSDFSVKYQEPKRKQDKKPEDKKEYIVVYINWNKYVDKFGKTIYADLLKKKIEAELINFHVDEINITAEPLENIKNSDKNIEIKLD